jgi:hypothetical protein
LKIEPRGLSTVLNVEYKREEPWLTAIFWPERRVDATAKVARRVE